MTDQLWWYAARAGGIVGWLMLSASVLWGLAMSTKVTKGHGPRPNWMLDLHRFLGAAAVVFTGIHVVSIVLDSYVHIGLAEVLVPFTGDWHPVAVAYGIVGAYLLLAVQVTSMLRKRLSKRAWRATHFLSFPLFGLATLHGLAAGSDASSPLFLFGCIAVSLWVVGLTALRISQAVRDQAAPAQPTRPRFPAVGPARPTVPAHAPFAPAPPSPPTFVTAPVPPVHHR